MRKARALLAAMMFLCCGAQASVAGQLEIGLAEGRVGQEVTIPVTYVANAGEDVAALSIDIRFDRKALSNPRCETGAALSESGPAKNVLCNEMKPGRLRLVVVGLNVGSIPAGEVARITFAVDANAPVRRSRLRPRVTGADSAGNEFRLRRKVGVVSVRR